MGCGVLLFRVLERGEVCVALRAAVLRHVEVVVWLERGFGV